MGISWKMIAVGVFGLFLLFGCLGSGASDKHTTVANTQTLTQTLAEEQKQKEAEEQKQKEAEEQKQKEAEEQKQKAAIEQTAQDLAWLGYTKSYCELLGPDFTGLSQAASSQDLDTFYAYAVQTRFHANSALAEDSKYHPSSKYDKAHTQWVSCMEDSRDSMDLIISCRNEGWSDVNKIYDSTAKIKEARVHLDSFTNYIKQAA
jgi:hypothetical protein